MQAATPTVLFAMLSTIGAGLIPVSAQSPPPGREELVRDAIQKLERLAKWCGEQHLARQRDHTYRDILILDSNHAVARQSLQYLREANGTWRQSSSYREPNDSDPKKLGDFEHERAAALATFIDGHLTLAEKATDPASRKDLVDQVVALAPEDAKLREFLGETKRDGKWVLRETVAAEEQAKKNFAAYQTELKAGAIGVAIEPDAEDQKLGLKWTAAAKVGEVVCLGTVPKPEIMEGAPVYRAFLRMQARFFSDDAIVDVPTKVYLLNTANDYATLLEKSPRLTADDRAQRKNATAFVLADEKMVTVAAWGMDAGRRRGSAAMQAASTYADSTIAVGLDHPFQIHGYMLFVLDFVGAKNIIPNLERPNIPPAERDLRNRMLSAKPNWTGEAKALLAAHKQPSMQRLMKLTYEDIQPSEALWSFVVIRYLVTGHRPHARAFMNALGSGIPPERAAKEILKLDYSELQSRIERWLSELR